MDKISNVIICGLGAIGTAFGEKILTNAPDTLRVLVDEERLNRYTKTPRIINNKTLNFNYVLPENKDFFKADLIIISVKSHNLDEVIQNIERFVTKDTIIISLLNGVTSEEKIAQKYGWQNILPAFYIGSSAMRNETKIRHDGIATIVFGAKHPSQKQKLNLVKQYFDNVKIDYKISPNIDRSLWVKFMLNVACNQLSAIFGYTFKDMQNNSLFKKLATKIMEEVKLCATAEGVKNTDSMINEVFEHIQTITPEGKTSMLQDIEAGRKTEVDIFAGSVIEIGERHKISTPINKQLKNIINQLEQKKLPQSQIETLCKIVQ